MNIQSAPNLPRASSNGSLELPTTGDENDDQRYVLLNDQPVDTADGDLLGTRARAEGIAKVLIASREASPFVLLVDAGWGMGKSTLLRQIESQLADPAGAIQKLRFNAWTAQGENALESLIKEVLGRLDPNLVRRWARDLARRRGLMAFARLGLALVARFLGAGRLIDELWNQLNADARSRNEIRDLIHQMLSDWIKREGKRDPGRALVVFIDDLDRCSDEAVVQVCEAVKLYLDAPGLIFVMACDHSVLDRSVARSARGEAAEGHSYLEKIVQVVYRLPPPGEQQIRDLILGYAHSSGTHDLIGDEAISGVLAGRASRNPRKIKRVINSFVLEYRLGKEWREPPLSSKLLVTAILLQHLYQPFYDYMVREESGEDPIGEFLDYMELRERVADPIVPKSNDEWWHVTLPRIFRPYQLSAPSVPNGDLKPGTTGYRQAKEALNLALQQLDVVVHQDFPMLARNNAFVGLLREIDVGVRKELRAQLISRPLATKTIGQEASAEALAFTESEVQPWSIVIPSHPRRSDSPDYVSSRRYVNQIAGSVDEFIYGRPPFQDHHGGGLWLKDEQGWFLVRNLAGIEWSWQFCADPHKVDLIRQNAKRVYAAFPEAAQELRINELLDVPITDAAGVARWTDSICNASVPLPPTAHTGAFSLHSVPSPVAEVAFFKSEDFHLWVTDQQDNPLGVASVTPPDSSPVSVRVGDPERPDSPEYLDSLDVISQIAGSIDEFLYGKTAFELHHGGGLWLKDDQGWFLARNLAGIEWSAQFCADPHRVDLIRQNARRVYAAFPEAAQELRIQELVDTPITDAAGVARWTDSICNASVPLPPDLHTGRLPGAASGGVHYYPSPITDIQLFKYDDLSLWVTDEQGNPAAVAPLSQRGSGDARVHVVWATAGSSLQRQMTAAETNDRPLILDPSHPLARQVYVQQ